MPFQVPLAATYTLKVSPAMASTRGDRTSLFSLDANTGPKGVIADALAYNQAREQSHSQTVTGASRAVASNCEKLANSGSVNLVPPDQNAVAQREPAEDEFLRTWRLRRMQELENGSRSMQAPTHTTPTKIMQAHGVAEVDALGYLDAIEAAPRDAVVVVLISNDEVCLFDWDSWMTYY